MPGWEVQHGRRGLPECMEPTLSSDFSPVSSANGASLDHMEERLCAFTLIQSSLVISNIVLLVTVLRTSLVMMSYDPLHPNSAELGKAAIPVPVDAIR